MGFTAALMTIGGLICLVSWIWLLVVAFRVSVVWGLVLFFLAWTFIPLILFASRNWAEAKRPLMLYGVGLTFTVIAYFLALATVGQEIDSFTEADSGPMTRKDSVSAADDPVLPPPRPTARPTHASWESVVDEIEEKPDSDWENFVPTPTPATGRHGGLEWHELESLIDRKVIIDLERGTVTTAALEAVEPHRLRIRHTIGGGETSYWIERDQITRIRLTY